MLGFATSVVVPEETADDVKMDPAMRAAWAFARSRGRLRAGDLMVHHRHMAVDCYQEVSPTINLIAMRVSFAPLEHKRLAWSFVALARPEGWLPLMQYINFDRAEEADFAVGERSYSVFAHDWRVEPFEAWWDQLCERSLSTEPVGEAVSTLASSPVVVLSEADFASSVRQALRDYTRPSALAANPLIRSRLVAGADGSGGDASRLQSILRDALDTLKLAPRDEKFYRALLYTYYQPAVTQEGAAERLGIPFNTYRYHLARGTERIFERLWDLELSGTT